MHAQMFAVISPDQLPGVWPQCFFVIILDHRMTLFPKDLPEGSARLNMSECYEGVE